MKKTIIGMFLTFWCLMLLMACGGGGGNENEPAIDNGDSALDSAVATLEVHADNCVFYPAMVNNDIVHLSDGAKEVSANKTDIVAVYWNDGLVGFHAVDSSKGLILMWDLNNPIITVPGPDVSASGGNISFLLKDGKELTVNTDEKWLVIKIDEGMLAERKSDGLICIYPKNVTPPIPPTEIPVHKISVDNGNMQIEFATVDGCIVELVKNGNAASLKTSDVHRVFWNGDVALWDLKDSNKYSSLLLMDAKTLITVPEHDNGIVRIVDTAGGVYSINTSKVKGLSLTTDGRQLLSF